jgi:hypothetical protein
MHVQGRGVTDPAATLADTPNLEDQIDSLHDAQLNALITQLQGDADASTTALKKTFTGAMSDLDATQSGIGQRYYGERNKAAAQSDIGAMNFAQYMGNQGVSGGAAGLPEAWRNMALQGDITTLNNAEAQENSAIDRSRSLLRSNLDYDVTALENKLRSDITAAGYSVEESRIQDVIDQLRADAEETKAATAEEKQAFIDTIARFYGTEQEQIDKLSSDNDPSNDWMIQYLDAQRVAREQQITAAAAKGSYSGGGGGGVKTQTLAQLDSDMGDIYSMNFDENGQLSDAGKQALYSYAVSYGGQYTGQLLAKYGLTEYTPGTTPITTPTTLAAATVGPDHKAQADTYITGLKKSVGAQGFNANQIKETLGTLVSQGTFSENDVIYILSALGL